jgi:post-segregation antitoxin (ccd killing protein)
MPTINVDLPDDLAEQVRKRDLPVSAICQRALRAEIAHFQPIEQAVGIKV